MSFEFQFEGKVAAAQLGERQAGFSLEVANSKKKVLVEYTKSMRQKQLHSDVEKARSEELAKRANWDLEQAKTRKLERQAKQNDLPADLKRSLVLLDRATGIQEEIRRKLGEIANSDNATDTLRNDIRTLLNRLSALVDQAEGERAAEQIDNLKPRVRQIADRYGAIAK